MTRVLPSRPKDAPPGPGLDKVREILFGAQLQEVDRRVALLEERIRAHVRAEIESVGRRLEQEVLSMRERLDGEGHERQGGDDELARRLQALSDNARRLLAELEGKLEERSSGLRTEMLAQSEQLDVSAKRSSEETRTRARQGLAELEQRKADRELLSNLLFEVAGRLCGEPKTSGSAPTADGTRIPGSG